MNSERRVVVTGLGLICGVGNTVGETWANLLAGNTYVNIHTPSFPGGEIRGQLVP